MQGHQPNMELLARQAWQGSEWCPEDACWLWHGLAATLSWGKLILHEGSGAACQGQPGTGGWEAGSWQLGKGLGGAGRGDKGKAPQAGRSQL